MRHYILVIFINVKQRIMIGSSFYQSRMLTPKNVPTYIPTNTSFWPRFLYCCRYFDLKTQQAFQPSLKANTQWHHVYCKSKENIRRDLLSSQYHPFIIVRVVSRRIWVHHFFFHISILMLFSKTSYEISLILHTESLTHNCL